MPARTHSRVWAGRYLPLACESIGFVVEIVSVDASTPGAVDDAEALLEGFESAACFRAAWGAINGSYDADAPCWRIGFRLVS